MSTTTDPATPADNRVADPSSLKPQISTHFALGLEHVVVTAVFALLLIYLSALSLWSTDLWSHVAYGRWILEHASLPTNEPFLPLAAGERVINYCWLSQVIFAAADRLGGPESLSNLFAIVVLARYLVLARLFYLQTHRLGLAVGAMVLAFGMGWVRNPIMRPEIFSALCFHLLLLILVVVDASAREPSRLEEGDSPRVDRWSLLAVVGLFAAWVNLHSTVQVGLLVLGAHLAGRVIEVVTRDRKLSAAEILGDPAIRRWFWLIVAASAGVLLNPSGPGAVIDGLRMAGNPNLRSVSEWLPPSAASLGGRTFALSWGVLVIIMRLSHRRVRPVEAILVGVFSIAVLQSSRMILWYVPIYLYCVLPHVAEILQRFLPTAPPRPIRPLADGSLPEGRSYRYTVVCLAVVWAGFALSHLSDRLLGADPRSESSLYHPRTPIALADKLLEIAPKGLIWNSQALGDWLQWAALNRKDKDAPPLQLFVNTHMHTVPRQVWIDYQTIAFLRSGWKGLLDKYQLDTLAISKLQSPELIEAVRELPGWSVAYEDDNGVIARRGDSPAAKPQPSPAPAPAAAPARPATTAPTDQPTSRDPIVTPPHD